MTAGAGALETTVAETAASLAAAPPAALAATRKLLDAAAAAPLDQVLRLEYERQRELVQTEEHQQAVRAFLARRARPGAEAQRRTG
jgi:2-(1,2-epoxy-1,2-dihydrophenyl)acetyl-CoA isomerase